MNNLLQCVGMMLSYAISIPIIQKTGIKPSFVIFYFMCCLSALLYIVVPMKSPLFVSILVFLGRLGTCPCYSLTFICSNLLFPIEVKSTLFAFCNIIARFITMGAPLVASLKDPLPFYAFGILSFICCIATLLLNFNQKERIIKESKT